MIALPSSALDFYNDYFSTHDLTYFCQISFLKPLVDCPYTDPLAIVMAKTYHLGNFNASLFATEGIASVGPALAPFTALGVRVRDCPRKSPFCRPEAALYPDIRSCPPPGFAQRAANNSLADQWRGASVFALVRNATLNFRYRRAAQIGLAPWIDE